MICSVSFKLASCSPIPVAWCAKCAGFRIVQFNIYGEFDPGSGRTLAACLTHASRTVTQELAPGDQWRTGE